MSEQPRGPCDVSLRRLCEDDRELLFRWRNDPWIVERGISQRKVTWEEHELWFSKKLKDLDAKVFIVERAGRPVGQLRLQRTSAAEAEITVYLTKDDTGQGFGVRAIHLGCGAAFDNWNLRRVVARILHNNPHSRRAFEKAGFLPNVAGGNSDYLMMSLERNR